MPENENCNPRKKGWSEWSIKARIGVILAGIILAPAFLALFAAGTMWLWNWLMPVIFKLPRIGFWQAAGLILLSHILFRGGHARKAGRSQWKKARIREEMREEVAGAKPE